VPREIFNATEAAEYIGLSLPTLRALLRRGAIPARQINGRTWLIRRDSIDQFVLGNGRVATPPRRSKAEASAQRRQTARRK